MFDEMFEPGVGKRRLRQVCWGVGNLCDYGLKQMCQEAGYYGFAKHSVCWALWYGRAPRRRRQKVIWIPES
jgi:hypothetical protein